MSDRLEGMAREKQILRQMNTKLTDSLQEQNAMVRQGLEREKG